MISAQILGRPVPVRVDRLASEFKVIMDIQLRALIRQLSQAEDEQNMNVISPRRWQMVHAKARAMREAS